MPDLNAAMTQEIPHFVEGPGAKLYTVLHATKDPIARVLLVGPFAPDRHQSYTPWVSWARYLAKRRVEVLRFDFRGVGESFGEFEDMSFSDWKEDVMLLAEWLRSREPALPLVLHGLQVGALLAAATFQKGLGDVLFLWSPPVSAHLALRQTLLRWVALDQLFKVGKERKTAAIAIRELEEGRSVDVEGYRWSPRLWSESKQLLMPPWVQDESKRRSVADRPVLVTELGNDAIPLVKGSPASAHEVRDYSSLFARNWDRLFPAIPAAGVVLPGGGRLTSTLPRVENGREPFSLRYQSGLIYGTYHPASLQTTRSARIGILFLPGFPSPRSAHGDVAVYWTDRLARQGYHAFRLDLPGSGDSNGEQLPNDLLQYLTAGGYENAVVFAMQELVARHRLQGLILLGHCAGAISSILAAAASKHCVGTILLDPPFYMRPPGKQSMRTFLFYWSGRTRSGFLLSKTLDQIRKIWSHLRNNPIPANANSYLLKRWKQITSSGLPILLLNAPALKTTGAKPRVGKFDYTQYIMKLAGNKNRVDFRVVEGANHTFSNPHARNSVLMEIDRWLRSLFPIADPQIAPAPFSLSISSTAVGPIADRAPAFQRMGMPQKN